MRKGKIIGRIRDTTKNLSLSKHTVSDKNNMLEQKDSKIEQQFSIRQDTTSGQEFVSEQNEEKRFDCQHPIGKGNKFYRPKRNQYRDLLRWRCERVNLLVSRHNTFYRA